MPKGDVKMDKGEIYHALEDDFAATFIKELIPGILHNFANPLNGIMGRSKLLQRRIEENVKKMEEMYPEASAGMMGELQKIRTDIRSVCQESECFFDMFRDVAGKFYALAAKNEDRINISQMLAAEMRFANFYLDFKHEIKKDIQLDKDVPDFQGSTANLSLAFWRIIRFAMSRALSSRLKEFYIKTEHDNKYVSVFIKSSGEAMPAADLEALMECLNSDSINMSGVVDQGVMLSLLLFNKYQARINVFSEENFSTISIGFPHHAERNKRKEI
jgi:signal transduction histidine kinase